MESADHETGYVSCDLDAAFIVKIVLYSSDYFTLQIILKDSPYIEMSEEELIYSAFETPYFERMWEEKNRHKNVYCDGCQSPIIGGNRWKCTECPNYDLCDKCANAESSQHFVDHKFRKIEDSRNEKK